MAENFLPNGGFEAGGWTRKTHTGVEYGEIYVPIGWVAWWEEGEYGRPEVKVIRKQPPFLDPARIHSGEWAVQIFTYCHRQHAGLYQVVENLMPGVEYELSAFAHAWSTKPGLAGANDAHCSAGVGCGPVCIPEGEAPPLNGGPENDAIGNFTFSVGVSFGEPDPFGDVQWGDGVHSYNAHHEIPPLRFIAPASGRAVVYLRAHSLWNFRTSDAYWDDALLYSLRGRPRMQYERTYCLLPPDADAAWAKAVVEARWNSDRWTIGGSADDSGLGDLDVRKVLAVNPHLWPDGLTAAWYETHYPGVDFVIINADTPEQLKTLLELPDAT